MKMFLVTDDVDARVGLRFAGVDGTLVKNAADAAAAIDAAVADEDVCVLLVTPGINKMCHEKTQYVNGLSRPVLCEIPDSKDPSELGSSLEEYIKNTVGIALL